MKKLFASLFVAFAMIAMVSCSSKPANDAAEESCSNPAIDAAEDFIDNPTKKNYVKVEKAEKELDADEKKEFEEWCKENAADLEAAALKAAFN